MINICKIYINIYCELKVAAENVIVIFAPLDFQILQIANRFLVFLKSSIVQSLEFSISRILLQDFIKILFR